MSQIFWLLLVGILLFLLVTKSNPSGNEKYQDIEACMGDCYQKLVAPTAERCAQVALKSQDRNSAYQACMKDLDPSSLNACYAQCTR